MAGVFGGDDGGGNASFTTPNYKELRKLNVGLNAGGIRTQYTELPGLRREIQVTPDAERQGYVTGIADTYGNEASQLRGILPQIAPGMSLLRKAQLAQIENDRSRTVGNLSETLSRRRVRGSSFANDSLARANAEFTQKSNEVNAATTLQELELTTKYIQEIGNLDRQSYATYLSELNVQTEIGLQLALASQQVTSNAANTATQVQIAQSQQQGGGFGEVLGSVVGAGTTLGSAYLLSG